MEGSEVEQLRRLTAPNHARLLEVRDVGDLQKVLAGEAERLRLVVESSDPKGVSGRKGKVCRVTDLPANKFNLQKGGLDLQKGLQLSLGGKNA